MFYESVNMVLKQNNRVGSLFRFLLSLASLTAGAAYSANVAPFRFEVTISQELAAPAKDGRLFVILSRTNTPEPCLTLSRTGLDAPESLARDVKAFAPGALAVLDRAAFAFPLTNFFALPAGDYFAQALFVCNEDLRLLLAPGNLYSSAQKIHLDPARGGTWKLNLTQQVPLEQLPADTESVKFVKMQSECLSEFYGRPIFLRAGIVLPRDYAREPPRRYPLWVRIGGLNTRYTSVLRQMGDKASFCETWLADDTPRVILLQLDGAGPNGDPYYVNSANNGPFGDALVEELIPHVESAFRAVGQPRARFLSGVSTGGWVCLALQVFYPDFFNGAWSSCPDPVDFRALELVNIYQDDNAYVNQYGNERPSDRDPEWRREAHHAPRGRRREPPGPRQQLHPFRRAVGRLERRLRPARRRRPPRPSLGPADRQDQPRGRRAVEEIRPAPRAGGQLENARPQAARQAPHRRRRGRRLTSSTTPSTFWMSPSPKPDPPFVGKIVYGSGKGHGWIGPHPAPDARRDAGGGRGQVAQRVRRNEVWFTTAHRKLEHQCV